MDAILDAAGNLLADGDLDAVTIRAVADTAGVPTGTIYQFFEDKQTVLQALAVRYVAATQERLTQVLDVSDGDWRDDVARVVDGYAALLKHAFTEDDAGSPAILAEARRVATLYTASLLGVQAA